MLKPRSVRDAPLRRRPRRRRQLLPFAGPVKLSARKLLKLPVSGNNARRRLKPVAVLVLRSARRRNWPAAALLAWVLPPLRRRKAFGDATPPSIQSLVPLRAEAEALDLDRSLLRGLPVPALPPPAPQSTALVHLLVHQEDGVPGWRRRRGRPLPVDRGVGPIRRLVLPHLRLRHLLLLQRNPRKKTMGSRLLDRARGEEVSGDLGGDALKRGLLK